ncbi:MAG: 30S ribosomal protein S12 methylthiotransferase RimO [Oceanidesulfovibrio sp.]
MEHFILVHVTSLGCPKNTVDTERLVGGLGPGITLTADPAAADLLLVNTCAFIHPAVEESVDTILELARTANEENPGAVLAVAGCLVQRYGAAELAAELPEVDLWLSPAEWPHWPDMAQNAVCRRKKGAVMTQGSANLSPGGPRSLSTTAGHAYLKLSEGCDHACGFCTIPSIKGPHVSFDANALVAEAEALAAGSYGPPVKELVLVGQDLTAWGRSAEAGSAPLVALLESLLKLDGLAWLRTMYLYPAGLDDRLLDFFRANAEPGGALLPYFDIPLQHAHPDMLRRMGRPFSGDPMRVVDRVRAAVPEAVLRTTFIVGYPGEEERHFSALEQFVREVRFQHMGAFPYWPEEGTRAAAMADQVEDAVKKDRLSRLMGLQAEISEELLEGYVGEDMDVLVDAPVPEWPGLHRGRVWLQAPEVDGVTYISGDAVRPGELVRASIEESKTYDLVALS